MVHLVRGAVVLFCFALPGIAQIPTLPLTDPAPAGQYYSDNSERFKSYIFRTYTDPSRIGWLLVDSAVDHWTRAPRQWDNSPESYSMRVASGWGRRIVRNTVQFGFETALKEDSRYRRSGEGKFAKRFLFAVSHSVLAYKPDGTVEPMYGRMAAGVVASATASTWHPQAINASCLLSGVAMGAVDRAGNNLLDEFQPDLKQFGRKTWNVLTRK
jgi:hypothetical protein